MDKKYISLLLISCVIAAFITYEIKINFLTPHGKEVSFNLSEGVGSSDINPNDQPLPLTLKEVD